MVEIIGTYEGDLRCTAAHGPSGAEIVTDAPKDNEGLGRAFSPTDLVATGLATCIMTILGIVARRNDFDISGARYRVEKHMVSDPKRRIGKLAVTVRLPARLGEADRARLERAARACPVHETLGDRVEMPIEFVYDQGTPYSSPSDSPKRPT